MTEWTIRYTYLAWNGVRPQNTMTVQAADAEQARREFTEQAGYKDEMTILGVTERPRCTCGALEYNGCFCNLNLSDFLATGQGRRV